MKNRLLAFSGLAATLLVPQLHAQGQATAQSQRGMTKSLPVGLSLAGSLPSSNDGVHLKEEGRATAFPTVWTAAAYPNDGSGSWVNYSKAAMFGTWADHMVINGHSSGNAVIPGLDNNGVPSVGATGTWMGVIVSVTEGSIGAPSSLFRMRVNGNMPGTGSRTTPGSDLVGFYFGESAGLPDGMAGSTLIEQVAEGMGMSSAGVDMDAIDFGLGVNTLNTATSSMLFFPSRTDYYFTLSAGSISAVNGHSSTAGRLFAEDLGGGQVAANAATVYHISWNGTGWGIPQEFRTPFDLGLNASQHDLDAIEVDSSGTITVFSVVNSVGPRLTSQLMIHEGYSDPVNQNPTYALRSYSGPNSSAVFVEDRIGATGDTSDTDGICIIDPEAYVLDTVVGIPVGHANKANNQKLAMGLSMVRTSSGPADAAVGGVTIEVSGWGQENPSKGYDVLYYSLDYDPLLPGRNGTWDYLTYKARHSSQFSLEYRFSNLDVFYGSTIYLYAEHVPVSDSKSTIRSWISGMVF